MALQMREKTVNLNRGDREVGHIYWTDNYAVVTAPDLAGYHIVNRDTEQAESFVETMPQAVMTLMWMQENYEEILGDPEREFKLRKDKMKANQAMMGAKSSKIIN